MARPKLSDLPIHRRLLVTVNMRGNSFLSKLDNLAKIAADTEFAPVLSHELVQERISTFFDKVEERISEVREQLLNPSQVAISGDSVMDAETMAQLDAIFGAVKPAAGSQS